MEGGGVLSQIYTCSRRRLVFEHFAKFHSLLRSLLLQRHQMLDQQAFERSYAQLKDSYEEMQRLCANIKELEELALAIQNTQTRRTTTTTESSDDRYFNNVVVASFMGVEGICPIRFDFYTTKDIACASCLHFICVHCADNLQRQNCPICHAYPYNWGLRYHIMGDNNLGFQFVDFCCDNSNLTTTVTSSYEELDPFDDGINLENYIEFDVASRFALYNRHAQSSLHALCLRRRQQTWILHQQWRTNSSSSLLIDFIEDFTKAAEEIKTSQTDLHGIEEHIAQLTEFTQVYRNLLSRLVKSFDRVQ